MPKQVLSSTSGRIPIIAYACLEQLQNRTTDKNLYLHYVMPMSAQDSFLRFGDTSFLQKVPVDCIAQAEILIPKYVTPGLLTPLYCSGPAERSVK